MEQIVKKLVEDFEQGKMTRRELIQSLTITAAAVTTAVTTIGGTGAALAQAAAPAPMMQATGFNHVSYWVKDYKKSRDFYVDTFGMKASGDDGTQCRLNFGDTQLVIRDDAHSPYVDHLALTIAGWDPAMETRLKAEAARRGLKTKGGGGSFHIYDLDGYDIQVGGVEQGKCSYNGVCKG